MYPNYMGLYVSMNVCLSHVSMDVYMHLYIPFSPSANRRVQGGESLYYMIIISLLYMYCICIYYKVGE
jgi:hypothetical protein